MLSASRRCRWVSPVIGLSDNVASEPRDQLILSIAIVPLQCVEDLGPRHEHRDRAGREQDLARPAWILDQIMLAALHRADTQPVDHEKGLELRLDREQGDQAGPHGHILNPHARPAKPEARPI